MGKSTKHSDVLPKGTLITAADGNAPNDDPMWGPRHPLVTAPYREHFVAAQPIPCIPALAAEDGERLKNGCPRPFLWLCK